MAVRSVEKMDSEKLDVAGASRNAALRGDTYTSMGKFISIHQRANMIFTDTSGHHKSQLCPFKMTHKRLLYECPRCHRHRSYMEDRDQFILYGMTHLWPTPPPAPPPLSAPAEQVDNPLLDSCLEQTYNICRVFHTRSAKLHLRTTPRRKNIIVSPGHVPKRMQVNKVLQRRVSPALVAPNPSPCSSPTANAVMSDDLKKMVDFLRRYVSPPRRQQPRAFMPSNSKPPTPAPPPKEEIPITPNSPQLKKESITPSLLQIRKTSSASSPKRSRPLERKTADWQSVRTLSPFSSSPSVGNSHQSISSATLELWTKRLRSGACLTKNPNAGKSIVNSNRGSSNTPKKKPRKKNPRSKRTKSKIKGTETPRANSVVPSSISGNDKSSVKSSSTFISGGSSTFLGSRSPLGERLADAITQSSRKESQRKPDRAATLKRARSFPFRPGLIMDELHEGRRENVNIVANIEAVKIDEEKPMKANEEKPAKLKRRASKRLRTRKSTGSIKLENETSEPEVKERPAVSTEDLKSLYSLRPAHDPEGMLEEFKSRMEKCQGKGHIKSSYVEVMAYLEGKKPETRFQSLPKTYQQMGLAPLVRSPSSENCLEHLKFTCALEVAGSSPKVGGVRSSHSKTKKKKKRNRSISGNASRNNLQESTETGASEVKSSEQSETCKQEEKTKKKKKNKKRKRKSPKPRKSQTKQQPEESATRTTVAAV